MRYINDITSLHINAITSRRRLLLQAVFLAALTSCATRTGNDESTHSTAGPGPQNAGRTSSETTTSGITSAGANSPDYGIGPGDVLQISVFQVPDLTREVRVDAKGEVLLPLIGMVRVAGKTTAQASQEIAAKLGAKYLQSPQVTVSVSHSAQKVSVNGAVQRPAVITLDTAVTLSQAVAEAGGPSEVADENRVHIARLKPDRTVNDMVFDLEAIQNGKTPDPQLQSGDIIVVEESNGRVVYKTIKDLLPFGSLAAVVATGI